MPPLSDYDRDVSTDRRRRLSFGSVAGQYDRHRPSYPAQLVDAVLEYAHARPGDPILDVGAGTGRATLLFAERGYELTAIEPDSEMAAVASKRAATAGQTIEMLNTDFEQTSLPEQAFQVLISATAWHWVNPGVRNALAARVLRPGGALAPFWNRPQWGENPLREQFDRIYREVEQEFAAVPGGVMSPFGAPPQLRNASEWHQHEFAGNLDFTDIDARVYGWQQRYTTDEYIALLGTHSDHMMLPDAPRERLFTAIRATIDSAGGSFELTYQTLLCLARRRAASAT
jgi:ubiquinone/menaquinone biosynthesis C-methylase UbiE